MSKLPEKLSEIIDPTEDKSLEITSWNGGLTVQKKIANAIFQYESFFDKSYDKTSENHQKRVIEELFLEILSKPLSRILESKNILEQEKFLQALLDIMQKKIKEGVLLERDKDYLKSHAENFHIIKDARENILGFFEFKFIKEDRKSDEINFAEMGAVFSTKRRVGHELIEIFELKRKKLGIPNGCAITKDENTAIWFAEQTGGEIKNQDNFPDWFKRNTNDRYFVCWE